MKPSLLASITFGCCLCLFFSLFTIVASKESDDINRIKANNSPERALKVWNVVQARNHLNGDNDGSSSSLQSFCIIDFVSSKDEPDQKVYGQFKGLHNYTSYDLCNQIKLRSNQESGYYLFDFSSSCKLANQLDNFANKFTNSSGILFSASCDFDFRYFNLSKETLDNSKFSISVIMNEKANMLASFNQLKRIEPMTKMPPNIPSAIIVIFFIAMFTVFFGAFWSGLVRYDIFLRSTNQKDVHRNKTTSVNGELPRSSSSKKYQEEAYVNFSTITVVVLVAFMIAVLLLLYFFYKYLVYFIIAIFLIATFFSLYYCLGSLAIVTLPTALTTASFFYPSMLFIIKAGSFRYINLLFLAISFALPMCWFIIRNQSPNAWILQNFLGVSFCINMIRTIRLPSFKICTIKLCILFVYDIFFVFVTPLLTSKGQSIMVEVATGGSSSSGSSTDYLLPGCTGKPVEMLPMLVRVPQRIFSSSSSDNVYDVCYNRDSLLGFGDILVPGLLIAYCHAFDLIRNVPYRLYFTVSVISYAIGLVVTFIALFLMSGTAQPALLYLVPCTIIPAISIAISRNEFRQFWVGPEEDLFPIGETEEEEANNLSSNKQLPSP